ncbi:hypothetical protein JCM10908_005992 [Rhodotorula pacifica]|uniref:uncharacterized protein n=1 Tax=Rhodotorula pacifica TaxID=1495444 RepID=UPI00316FCD52
MATPESTSPPAPASATSESVAPPAAAVAPPPRRIIPGLSPALVPPQTQPKQRKRAPKKQASSTSTPDTPNLEVPIPLEAKLTENDEGGADDQAAAAADREDDALLAQQEGKPSAAEVVQKRLRATSKKIQRIEGYEASTVALNPDQQRAVQGKPALQAVVRELSELLVLLKADEAEEDARQRRLKVAHEKKQTRAVEAAVKIAQKEAQSKLVFLFQFLHLHSLVNPQQQLMMGGFAPAAELPAILESASSQEIAAVRYLADAFANGPLLGGGDDATEKLAHLFEGSKDEVLPGQGVPYERIRYLVHGLTAPPASSASTTFAEGPETTQTAPPSAFGVGVGLGELGDDVGASASVPGTPRADSLEDDERERADQPAGPADSVVALVDGALEPEPHPVLPRPQAQNGIPMMSFLQPSEVDAAAAAASAPATNDGPSSGMRIDLSSAQGGIHGHSPLSAGNAQSAETPRAEEKVQSWADDLAQDGQLPPPEETPTPLLTPTLGAAPAMAQPQQVNGQATTQQQQEPPKLDWAADEDDLEGGGLPHLPELAPAVPLVAPAATTGSRQPQQQQQAGAPTASSDGFQPARPSRRGSERGARGGGGGGGGGGGRGGMHSRGSFRGGRGGSSGPRPSNEPGFQGAERPPRGERTASGNNNNNNNVERRESFRGGRGGGRGRGEGRGARGRGSYQTPVAQDATA